MRIAQVATAATPVRRHNSGSVEALVWRLSRELVRLGHEVTVFGVAGSESPGQLVETLPGPYATNGSPDEWLLCEWLNLTAATERSEDFDVVHSHAYLMGVPLQPFASAPFVHTTHLMPGSDQAMLASAVDRGMVTAVSAYQWHRFPEVPPAAVVHHGVDEDEFDFDPRARDYACFLGRFLPGKGPAEAIDVARREGVKLLLAGPENEYFREVVRPLVDGDTVEYVGSVTGEARIRLLQGAKALLYPLLSGEPFGLVLIEAMMCGTPVAALDAGAVSEIVDEGVTGCTSRHLDDLGTALRNACELDRSLVRRRAVERFTTRSMAAGYLDVYSRLLAQGAT